MQDKKETKEKVIKSISEYYLSIIMSLSCVQFMTYIICFILKKSLMILHLLPIISLWSIYICFKDFIKKEKDKNISFFLLKCDTVIFVIATLNNGILSILNKIAQSNPFVFKEGMIVLILIDIMGFLVSLAVFLNKPFNEKMALIHETDTKSLLNKKTTEEIKPGDAVIGYDLKTNKPVILPLKDRYLHMLIIGPTGSGKTSQSVIPMINRDMTNPDIGITVLEPKGKLNCRLNPITTKGLKMINGENR